MASLPSKTKVMRQFPLTHTDQWPARSPVRGCNFQPGAFIKLRELSATYNLSPNQASMIKARNASFTVSARNLWKWSKYRGVDPESDFTVTSGGDNPSDFQTMGIPTYFIFKFNFGF